MPLAGELLRGGCTAPLSVTSAATSVRPVVRGGFQEVMGKGPAIQEEWRSLRGFPPLAKTALLLNTMKILGSDFTVQYTHYAVSGVLCVL